MHTTSGAVVAAHGHGGEAGGHHHVSSLRRLTGVLIALLALTALTVYIARFVDLGDTGNMAAAIVIASIKAALVCAFFMHLLHDKKLNAIVVFFCILAVATFLMFTLIDLGSRAAVDPVRDVKTKHPEIVDRARADAAALEAQREEHAPASEEH